MRHCWRDLSRATPTSGPAEHDLPPPSGCQVPPFQDPRCEEGSLLCSGEQEVRQPATVSRQLQQRSLTGYKLWAAPFFDFAFGDASMKRGQSKRILGIAAGCTEAVQPASLLASFPS